MENMETLKKEVRDTAFRIESFTKLLGVILESDSNDFGNREILQEHLIESVSSETQKLLSLSL